MLGLEVMLNKNCPICDKTSIKVIYYGFPVRICEDGTCSCMFGFWTNITSIFPFNGWMMEYEGSYFKALYDWIRGGVE